MIILDIKSGSENKLAHILQLAAYKILVKENLKRLKRNYSLDLKIDSKYYTWKNKKYIRTTEAIGIYTSQYVKEVIFTKEIYSNRGKWVHNMAQSIDAGFEIDIDTLAENITPEELEILKGYIKAWLDFRKEYDNIIDFKDNFMMEIPLISDEYGSAGTLDRIFNFHQKDDIICWNVYLKPTGDFKVIERTIGDIECKMFLNTLEVYKYKQGLKKNKE